MREELVLTGVRGLLEELLGAKYEAALAKDALLGGRALWRQIDKIEKGIGRKVLPERAKSAAWVVEAVRDFCWMRGLYFDSEYCSDSVAGNVCIGIFCGSPCRVLVELSDWLHRLGVEDVGKELGEAKIDGEGEECVLYFQKLRMGR